MNAAPVRSVYPQQLTNNDPTLEAASREGGGDCSVILSLHDISTETQAPSRLAVLRRELVGGRSVAGQWQRAYCSSPSTTIFGSCLGGRMLALPLFAGADPRANAKQEGTP